MPFRHTAGDQWVICSVGQNHYAFPSVCVQEMLAMPAIRSVPKLPPYVRGVLNLRGRVMPLIDLRLRLGMASTAQETEELAEMINQRKQDHMNWLAELESCTIEGRPFTLATDPHKCAFGKWYDSYTSSNSAVSTALKTLDAPHRRIHGIASQVTELLDRQAAAEARGLIERTRTNVLATMIRLLDELITQIQNARRETAVVMEGEGAVYAVSVDLVESVERLKEGTLEEINLPISQTNDGIVVGIARRLKNDELVLVLDSSKILEDSLPSDFLESSAA